LLYVDNTVRGELTDNGQGLGALGLRKSGGSNISGGRSRFGSLSGIKSGSGVGRVLTLHLRGGCGRRVRRRSDWGGNGISCGISDTTSGTSGSICSSTSSALKLVKHGAQGLEESSEIKTSRQLTLLEALGGVRGGASCSAGSALKLAKHGAQGLEESSEIKARRQLTLLETLGGARGCASCSTGFALEELLKDRTQSLEQSSGINARGQLALSKARETLGERACGIASTLCHSLDAIRNTLSQAVNS
jgi:hypothetical protein